MAGRYDSSVIHVNRHLYYKDIAKKRNLKYFRHFGFQKIHNITEEEMEDITTISHIWKQGDRYFKLAYEHYGDPELWWIIAWFNQKPTEGHLEIGEFVYIPHPVEELMGLFYER